VSKETYYSVKRDLVYEEDTCHEEEDVQGLVVGSSRYSLRERAGGREGRGREGGRERNTYIHMYAAYVYITTHAHTNTHTHTSTHTNTRTHTHTNTRTHTHTHCTWKAAGQTLTL